MRDAAAMTRFALLVAAELLGFAVLISAGPQSASPAESGQGCETATLMLLAERERARREYERMCLEASGLPDNPFVRVMCEPPP
jgi:hypothetical protein